MVEGEPRPEEEKSPKQAVADAVSTIESGDTSDPVNSSEWMKKAKEFFSPSENWKDLKTTGKVAGITIGAALFLSYRVLRGGLKFAKKIIEKKGKVGFSEGWDIGSEIFSFEGKKDSKK